LCFFGERDRDRLDRFGVRERSLARLAPRSGEVDEERDRRLLSFLVFSGVLDRDLLELRLFLRFFFLVGFLSGLSLGLRALRGVSSVAFLVVFLR
jgi:hypothetical protein